MLSLSLPLRRYEMTCQKSINMPIEKDLRILGNTQPKSRPHAKKQKQKRRNSFDHKGEKCGIKIQGQALMFTQEETRTWHSLGSWICEFKASDPTSNSTMHNFPLAGRSGMPKYFLIHLSGLFLLWPPASVLHNSAGRTHRRKVKVLACTAATHAKNAHTWLFEDLLDIHYLMFSAQWKTAELLKRQNAKRIKCECHVWKCQVLSGERKKTEQNYSNSSRPQGMWPGSVCRQAQHVITHTLTPRQRRQRKPCYHNCTASQTDSREDGR